jgi:hypothetical protein
VGAAPTQSTTSAPNPAQVLASATPKEVRQAAKGFGLTNSQLAPLLKLAKGN